MPSGRTSTPKPEPLWAFFVDPSPPTGGRPVMCDQYAKDYARLDAISRRRALTLAESLRLEECINRIDQREGWRERKRGHRQSSNAANRIIGCGKVSGDQSRAGA